MILTIPKYEHLLGVPFVDDGRDVERDGGLSCVGFVLIFYRLAGLAPIDPRVDLEGAEAQWDVIEDPPFLPMDMLSMGREGQEVSAHVGAYLGNDWIAHSSDPLGVNKANLRNLSLWVDFAYRWKAISA